MHAISVFSVVGEALNFGARRMETIMRVAWLPVVLLLMLNMVTLFAYVSVSAGRLVTFEEVVPTFAALQRFAGQAANQLMVQKPIAFWSVTSANFIIQLMLIASFMAPLIRLAGLGEKPAPGVVRTPFGPDQIRFIAALAISAGALAILFAPMAATVVYTSSYVAEAFEKFYAAFPDADSLHTLTIVEGREVLAERGRLWEYVIALPIAAAAPFFLILWGMLFQHFKAENTARGGKERPIARAIKTLFGGAIICGFAFVLLLAVNRSYSEVLGFGVLLSVCAVLFLYFQARVIAYPGVVVCRRSMAIPPALGASRGWNIVRVFLAAFILSLLLSAVQYVINTFVLSQWLAGTINALYFSLDAYLKVLSGGETAPSVRPTFILIWNFLKILINIFWMFFSYGVLAGLLGRLYRETEPAGIDFRRRPTAPGAS